MADVGRSDPFEQMLALVAGPFSAVVRSFDQLRRGADEMMRGVENFNTTMENLNETAARVNRLLNDFEEPIRAMLPQITRTVKLAEELSNRMAGPVEQVAPGLSRLADTLNNPVFSSMPRDLGQFMEIINDVGRRMSPLAQMAEQAGNMFGLRIPGFGGGSSRSAPAPAPAPAPEPPPPAPRAAPAAAAPRQRATSGTKRTTKKAAAKKRAAKK